ncbi:P-loop containing nucleoside triphosphate hydrolase protein [Ceratobasidium sp. AG-I]|nr:P-loop containing nucleoside triphosphate hydrolase protein [Ceratobasidium sp. AG-I]
MWGTFTRSKLLVACPHAITRRTFYATTPKSHENPLGLPRSGNQAPPSMPRRGGPIVKRPIPNARKVVVVASGKGGVGKSTVSVNLALALAKYGRVGLLDLDIFGPSIPKLMGLEGIGEPELTKDGRLVPLVNHGLPCMSMGFLIPQDNNTAIVWRGLMVQKAVQQLLFDVDWRGHDSSNNGLDVLVIDMPPGTGDVALTLGQLVDVSGAVIVSTPQDVALIDARKGVAMFRKVSVPIFGTVLNMAHYTCYNCQPPHKHYIFGSPESFLKATSEMGAPVLGQLPLVPYVSSGGDEGTPAVLGANKSESQDSLEVQVVMRSVAEAVWGAINKTN